MDAPSTFRTPISLLRCSAVKEANPNRLLKLSTGEEVSPMVFAELLHDKFVEADIDHDETYPSSSAEGNGVIIGPWGGKPEEAPEQLGLGM